MASNQIKAITVEQSDAARLAVRSRNLAPAAVLRKNVRVRLLRRGGWSPRPYQAKAFTTRAASRIRSNFAEKSSFGHACTSSECSPFLAGRRQIGRFDRSGNEQKLFEGDVQWAKAALTENEGVVFEHFVADAQG
jgi:hypothetical protein